MSFCAIVLQRKILPVNLLVTFPARVKYLFFEDTLLKCLDQNEIDLEGIREEVDTFMFEVFRLKFSAQNPDENFQGHDTTAAAMTWAMQEIGQHPEVLKKLHEEVELVFGDSDRPATMEDLDRLTVCAFSIPFFIGDLSLLLNVFA